MRAPGEYATAASPRVGDHVTIDHGTTVFVVWAKAPDAGHWWIVPASGGQKATAVHWRALRMA